MDIFSARTDAWRSEMQRGQVPVGAPRFEAVVHSADGDHGGDACTGCSDGAPCSGCGQPLWVNSPAQQALQWGGLMARGDVDPFWKLATIAESLRSAPARDASAEWKAMEQSVRYFQVLSLLGAQGSNASMAVADLLSSADGFDIATDDDGDGGMGGGGIGGGMGGDNPSPAMGDSQGVSLTWGATCCCKAISAVYSLKQTQFGDSLTDWKYEADSRFNMEILPIHGNTQSIRTRRPRRTLLGHPKTLRVSPSRRQISGARWGMLIGRTGAEDPASPFQNT